MTIEMQPKVIIPIQPKSLAEAKKMLRTAAKQADLIEIWLDGIKDLDAEKVRELVRAAKKPLIVNLKDKQEQGTFRGGDPKRVELLNIAAKAGAKYIDLPLTFAPKLIREFRKMYPRTKLILSWHDFEQVPSLKKLQQLAQKAENFNADVIKLVGTAQKWEDNFQILAISRELAKRKKAFLIMAMGEYGQVSRALTPLLGGLGMFAALTVKGASAAGQLTAKELKKWWQDLDL